MYVIGSFFLFISYVQSANILGVFMFPSYSHQVVYQPIWRELSLRGHNVTVITPDPLNDSSLKNLTEISVRFTYDILKETKIQEIMSKEVKPFPKFRYVIAEAELESPQFQKLIHSQQHFDLILIECYHPVMYALAGKFKAPIIGVSSIGILDAAHDLVGNPNHPVLYPEFLLNFYDKELTFWQKIKSVLFSLWQRYYHNNIFVPRAHEMAKKYFGDDIPYVGDLERNVSMFFLNVNPVMYPARPHAPAIVELGQMHIKPVKALPQNLLQILDASKEDVVYFSLGTNVQSVHLDINLRNLILQAFSELPYIFLWKWEADHLPRKPPNVFTMKWFPQQDVLAHPKIRAFITQGGFQSIEEAISREVPLIGIPFMSDQPLNVQKVVDLGIGISVDPATLTKNELKTAISEVVENNKYRKTIKEVHDLLYDKAQSGLEKAVWWSEYIIRHKEAKHLKAVVQISWIEHLLLDTAVTISLLCIVLCLGFRMVLSYSYLCIKGVMRMLITEGNRLQSRRTLVPKDC